MFEEFEEFKEGSQEKVGPWAEPVWPFRGS
jgi:hypothetical protein